MGLFPYTKAVSALLFILISQASLHACAAEIILVVPTPQHHVPSLPASVSRHAASFSPAQLQPIPAITPGPSPKALDLRLQRNGKREDLVPRAAPLTCGNVCIVSVIENDTTCTVGDLSCECTDDNTNIIGDTSFNCVEQECGVYAAAAYFSSVDAICLSYLATGGITSASASNGDASLPTPSSGSGGVTSLSGSSSSSSASHGLSKGAIVGIAIGSVFGAAVLGIVLFWVCRRCAFKRMPSSSSKI